MVSGLFRYWDSNNFVISLFVLCCYGFFKEIRPSEPFLTNYLLDPRWGNLPKDDLYSRVYPVYTYSSFVLLFPAFLLTDYVRYKSMIILGGISYIVTWVLLLWSHGVSAMQGMQFSYGVAIATEVAYYTYIYAKVRAMLGTTLKLHTELKIKLPMFISQ